VTVRWWDSPSLAIVVFSPARPSPRKNLSRMGGWPAKLRNAKTLWPTASDPAAPDASLEALISPLGTLHSHFDEAILSPREPPSHLRNAIISIGKALAVSALRAFLFSTWIAFGQGVFGGLEQYPLEQSPVAWIISPSVYRGHASFLLEKILSGVCAALPFPLRYLCFDRVW